MRVKRWACRAWGIGGMVVLSACGGEAQESPNGRVISADRELGDLAAALLPDLARRSGLKLRAPIRIEKRSREQLMRYLKAKLDEEVPEDEARATVEAYALLGLVPDSMDLRALLLELYAEQVAAFYEPDSTALFVMDDQPAATLQGLMIHELVHAVQDQSADLDALTDPRLGHDRQTAAQAAIEGHATLVMLEYLTEQMRGAPVDLADVPDFGNQLRPALEGMRTQYPALGAAPRVIQESLLFPYLEGAGFVQSLWVTEEGRPAPFGRYLPRSTEQILEHDLGDEPVELTVEVPALRAVHSDVLGRLDLGILLDTCLGEGGARLAEGWGGDRYLLVEREDGGRGLVWASVWDDESSRDAFVRGLAPALGRFPRPTRLTSPMLAGRPGAILAIDLPVDLDILVREAPRR